MLGRPQSRGRRSSIAVNAQARPQVRGIIRSCRRQSGPLEPALGPPGSATTHTGRYTTPSPSGKLHPQAVGGADGRYGGSPEGQTVTRAVPPIWGSSKLTGMALLRDYCPRSAVAAGRAWLTWHTGAVCGGSGDGERRAVVIKRPAVPKIMDLLKET